MLMAIPHELILKNVNLADMGQGKGVKVPDDFPVIVYMGVAWCRTDMRFIAQRRVGLFHWRMELNP